MGVESAQADFVPLSGAVLTAGRSQQGPCPPLNSETEREKSGSPLRFGEGVGVRCPRRRTSPFRTAFQRRQRWFRVENGVRGRRRPAAFGRRDSVFPADG